MNNKKYFDFEYTSKYTSKFSRLAFVPPCCNLNPKLLGRRKLQAHLEFLSTFLRPTQAASFNEALWCPVLNEAPAAAFTLMRERGLIVEAGVAEKLWLCSVTELRESLKSAGLKVSGRKPDLIERLQGVEIARLETINPRVGQRDIFICSESGRKIASEYVDFRARERSDAEAATLKFLTALDIEGAVNVVVQYQRNQVFPMGLGVDWNGSAHGNYLVGSLREIFETSPGKPTILSSLDPGQFGQLQIAAAWLRLWRKERRDLLPAGFADPHGFDASVAARMISFFVSERRGLEESRAFGVRFVTIMTSEPCCDACAALSRMRYPISEVPELPHAGCTEPRGCRCCYSPEIEIP